MNTKNEQKTKKSERLDISFRENTAKIINNLEKLKQIYNEKTNT